MKNYIRRLVPLLSLLLLLLLPSGCDRRDITYYMESEITVEADWSRANLDEEGYGATVIFFPEGGGEPVMKKMGDRCRTTVRLPEGRYQAVIFNRSEQDFGNVSFTGSTFADYYATARRVETRMDEETRVTTRLIVGTPEQVAGDCRENFEVSEAMLGNYSSGALTRSTRGSEETDPDRYVVRFTPRPRTIEVSVQIHIPGINNLRSAVGVLSNVSESVHVGSGRPSEEKVQQQFALTDIAYDPDSPFNGTLSGRLNVFGFDETLPHSLTLKTLLVDGKTRTDETFEVDARKVEEEGRIVIYIEVDAQKLPDVKPDNTPDSGFDATVDDWGDPDRVEL